MYHLEQWVSEKYWKWFNEKIIENTVKQRDLPHNSVSFSTLKKKLNKRIIQLFETSSLNIVQKIRNKTKNHKD